MGCIYTAAILAIGIRVVYHLQKISGNFGWKVNGTRHFSCLQWKFSGINGTSEKVVLFPRLENSKREFVNHLPIPRLKPVPRFFKFTSTRPRTLRSATNDGGEQLELHVLGLLLQFNRYWCFFEPSVLSKH